MSIAVPIGIEEAGVPLVDLLWGLLVASYGTAGPFCAVAALCMLLALLAVPMLMKWTQDPLERFSFRDERLKHDLARLRAATEPSGNLHRLAPLLEPTSKDGLSDAAEMHDKRLMRAKEKANVLPTKLTLGTMAFTVPPLILILAGPSVIQIVRSLTQFGSGR